MQFRRTVKWKLKPDEMQFPWQRNQWPTPEEKIALGCPLFQPPKDEVPLPEPNPEQWPEMKVPSKYKFPLDESIYEAPAKPPKPGLKYGGGREEDGKLYLQLPNGEKVEYWGGIGRRKVACAVCKMMKGTGQWLINGKRGEYYFHHKDPYIWHAIEPMDALNVVKDFDVIVKTWGGGKSGQAQAMGLAIARALYDYNIEWKPLLRRGGYLTRDMRMREMKKTGIAKARKANPYSKR